MTPKFLTNGEAQKRIAELESQLKASTAGGATNSARDIDSDEAILALMKSDRLKREAAKGASNSAQPTASAAAVAVRARLDAAKATFAAAEAKATARKAAAALQPAARAVQQPAAAMPANLSASERRAFAKSQSVMTAENATRFTDSYLTQAATNQFSPPAEKEIARAELTARGFIFHPNGCTSKSHI
jgi:hypothetical protein